MYPLTLGQILLDGENLLKKAGKKCGGISAGQLWDLFRKNPMTAFNLHVPVGTQMSETFRKRLRLDKNAARKLSMGGAAKGQSSGYGSGLSFLPQPVVRRDASAGNNGDFNWPSSPTVHFLQMSRLPALDEENKAYLIQELMRMKQQAAILFVSHDDAAIRTLCDNLACDEERNHCGVWCNGRFVCCSA